ncbi:MAG: exodeoxyribonuclease VII large subunit, partial [Opitutales bacterium]|nr:exodeoxyribonuclease VII large subunit [Opitutales bacterium]
MGFLKSSDEILSVGEFTSRLKMLLATNIPELWLRGEVSGVKTYSSGHTYFSLKDENALVSAVLFKGYKRGMDIEPKEGMKVLAYGEISVYDARGSYQLVVKALMPDGAGELAQKFEELKAR